MANTEQLEMLRGGLYHWNVWREKNRDLRIDLSGADLSGYDLHSASLQGANLREANLSRCNLDWAQLRGAVLDEAWLVAASLDVAALERASLRGANLSAAFLAMANCPGADFTCANLHQANCAGAILRGSSLIQAQLYGANLSRAELDGARMDQAIISATVFGDNDLSTVGGLDTVRHQGPCVIGIETIYRSGGRIPEPFLRGCGLPEDFIAYAKSLATRPIEFYSCFISYSSKDQSFADRLYADLQNKGVRCWFAPHDIQGGRKIHEQIDEAIRVHDRLLLILSQHSMESEWVKTEIAKARKREARDGRRVLFPIRLVPYETLRDWECFDADTGKDSAREIREYFIPDFSNWKNHDSYQEAFQSLIRDLKASDAKAK